MLQLKKDGSWDSCEQVLGRIPATAPGVELAVPNGITGSYLGGEVSQVQVVCTWAAANPSSAVRAWARGDDKEREFVQGLPGLIAGLLGRPFLSATEGNELGDGIALRARQRMDELHDQPIHRGRGMRVDVLCADHLGRPRPAALYRVSDGTGRLMDLDAFERSVDRILDLTVPQAYGDWLGRSDRRVVSDLLYESFKNTDEHATLGLDGNELPMSFRGLAVRHHLFPRENLATAAAGSRPLAGFYRTLEPPQAGNSQVQLLELSVFDCGVGYASHLLRTPLDGIAPGDEYDAVIKCFEKNVSSKARAGAGQGLALIAALLHRHGGFLRVRTGRLSLCASRGDEEPFRLVDAVGGGAPIPRHPVRGTVITCILPMRKR